MKTTIDKFLNSKTIGIAGISVKPQKFGNALYREITSAGYDVYPVSRNAETIEGKNCFRDISSLYGLTENLIIATGKKDAADIINNLAAVKIKRVWLVHGSESEQALKAAEEKNLKTVHGICPLMFFKPDSIHKFHLFFSKLFGNYKKVYS
ncbi:MAG: CoA-binding protein [Bacteroidetes bacterium]|nr:CoA-binding protein [Bacteroidota bacterium]